MFRQAALPDELTLRLNNPDMVTNEPDCAHLWQCSGLSHNKYGEIPDGHFLPRRE